MEHRKVPLQLVKAVQVLEATVRAEMAASMPATSTKDRAEALPDKADDRPVDLAWAHLAHPVWAKAEAWELDNKAAAQDLFESECRCFLFLRSKL